MPTLSGERIWAMSTARARRSARMHELHDATTDPKFDYFKRHLDVQMQAATAWIAYRRGQERGGSGSIAAGWQCGGHSGQTSVSPGALVPAREQLGDLLLELNRPQEAQKEFEAALKIYPGRFQALYGAAQAAERSRDKESASPLLCRAGRTNGKGRRPRSEVIRARAYSLRNPSEYRQESRRQ